jgi:hypothetical protein
MIPNPQPRPNKSRVIDASRSPSPDPKRWRKPMNPLKKLFLFSGIASVALADFSNDGVPVVPNVLTRIIAGAERSGEPLQSKTTKDESTVFYLRRAEYVGECEAPFGTVHVAQLFYIRSGVRGQQTPPPRGHTFLVFYDSEFRVRGYWREQGDTYSVDGSKLLLDGNVIFDYANPTKHTAMPPGQWPHPPIWDKPQRQQDGSGQTATRPESK